ncbi:SHD1 domain-containing protein [Prosthecobacter sp.]|uniref:SHD1 domain-containing protein n=1 Tax=Prosthecobacter sp. TaxID=1965333 RepID=UPI0037841DBE
MKLLRPLGIVLALTTPLLLRAQTAAPAMHTWTSTDGRKIEAAYVALEGESVKIRMANGSTFTVPLNRLSAEDQAFAKSQGAPAASTTAASPAAGTATGAPPASKNWPRTVALDEKPAVTVVKEDAEAHEFIYRSPHYEFKCDSKLGANVVREFGRMFEATWMINCMLPLDLKPHPERLREIFLAHLFTEESDYKKAGGIEGSAGVYMTSKKALMVPIVSLGVRMVGNRVSLGESAARDNSTLIHEITHQMMNHWMGILPTWYVEGSAEYVSMLEYNSNGRFSLIGLNRQLQNFTGGKDFMMIDIEELMTIDYERWTAALGKGGSAHANYASAGALTYYFYHVDGKGDAANIIAWLREIENVKRDAAGDAAVEAATKKHLLRERSYAQLAEEVKKGLRKEGIDVTFFPPGKNGPASNGK